jgi:hypothetical protein
MLSRVGSLLALVLAACPPEGASTQVDGGALVDGGVMHDAESTCDEAAFGPPSSDPPMVANPPACPASSPTLVGPTPRACTLAADVECAYVFPSCDGVQHRLQHCVCEEGRWSCLLDLCKPDLAARTSPPECCETCPEETRCQWVAEVCPAGPDLYGSKRCGTDSGGFLEADCYGPLTCRGHDGCNCVSDAQLSTSDLCPTGSTRGPCVAHPCRTSDPRPSCLRAGAPPRTASCIYGQWACTLDRTLDSCR